MPRYALAGGRPGWNLQGLARTDLADGYSEFRDASGTVKTVVRTDLLIDGDD